MSYSDQLQDRRWQRRRLERMSAEKWTCQRCGCIRNEIALHVHHLEYLNGRAPWDYPDDLLLVVCNPCHKEIHGLRRSDPMLESLFQHMVHAHDIGDWDELFKAAETAQNLIGAGMYYRSPYDVLGD